MKPTSIWIVVEDGRGNRSIARMQHVDVDAGEGETREALTKPEIIGDRSSIVWAIDRLRVLGKDIK